MISPRPAIIFPPNVSTSLLNTWQWTSIFGMIYLLTCLWLSTTGQPLTCRVLGQVLWFGWEILLQCHFIKNGKWRVDPFIFPQLSPGGPSSGFSAFQEHGNGLQSTVIS